MSRLPWVCDLSFASLKRTFCIGQGYAKHSCEARIPKGPPDTERPQIKSDTHAVCKTLRRSNLPHRRPMRYAKRSAAQRAKTHTHGVCKTRRGSNKPKRTPPGCAKRSEAQMCQNADPRGVQNASLERLWVDMRTGQENQTNGTETDTSHERFGLPPNRKNLALAQNATLRCMQNTKSQIAYPTGV